MNRFQKSVFFWTPAFTGTCARLLWWSPLSRVWISFILLMENCMVQTLWTPRERWVCVCEWSQQAVCCMFCCFFCLSSAGLWCGMLTRCMSHLQICLLHKSLAFSIVDAAGKLAGSEKVLFKHPQLLSCPTLGIFLIHKWRLRQCKLNQSIKHGTICLTSPCQIFNGSVITCREIPHILFCLKQL